MALPETRIHRGRPTPFPWERQALDLVYSHRSLSDTDPHQAWELHELYDPSSGRLYELDLLFLSRQGLFLVEIKSHPGVLTGDIVDWTITENGRRRTMECPYPGANLKAKVLGDLLERQLGSDRPYVHAAVFLSNVTEVKLEGGRPPWLLLPEDVGSKLVNGLDGRDARRIVNRPMMKQLLLAAHKIGLRPSTTSRMVGGYQLGTLLDDGEGYQEHVAKNTVVETDLARVRSYLVPAATSAERRSQLHRAAKREAQTLAQIGQHPGILAYRSFVDDAPLGPAVLFEAFEESLPLHAFIRQEPDLTFDERLGLLQQIVEAVAHCHRSGVLHRNLSPASVLVRRGADGRLSVRLHRFQTAAWIDHSSVGTRHFHQLSQDVDRLYQAPEVLADPEKATYESDVFSVGCLAWLVLTGQHPASTLMERELRIKGVKEGEGGLRPSSVRADLAILDEAIATATQPNLHARADDIAGWFDAYVLEALTRPTVDVSLGADPRDAQKGDTLPGGLRVERRLGSGGTALVLQVRREGRDFALKVPHDAGCGERLLAEAKTLRELRHEHIVALKEIVTLGGLPCLLLEFAGDRSLGDVLREQGTLPLDLARRYGDDLLSAVQYLEEAGVTHRDIKPTNVGFTSVSKKQSHLLLLDFSLSSAEPTAINAGTAEWRDPWLYLRGAWDVEADRYAAAAVLYHALTAVRPMLPQGDATGEVVVEAERFDAAVRDRLMAFFRKAFAREQKARFAGAEAMRQAWGHALSVEAESDAGASAIALDQVRPETPVDALPLSARARNALDRAGVSTVLELLLLPRNQLSVVRGVGTQVARDIVRVADELRTRFEVESRPAFVPGFSRPRMLLEDPEADLDASTVDRLFAAGIKTTLDAALANAARVERVIGESRAAVLRDRLVSLAAAEPMPGSLGDWARELIGRASQSEANRRLRVLVGLDPMPDEREEAGLPATRPVSEVASAFEIDSAQIHSSLQFLRSKRWATSAAAAALTEAVTSALEVLAPAAPFLELARAVADARTGGVSNQDDLRISAALLRVALEMRPHAPAAWRRIGATPWVAREPEVLDALAALAATADGLAFTEPLPSSEVVRSRLSQVVEGTALAVMPPDQRVTLAARASASAAASARLELYPRGMSAQRALSLSLPGHGTPTLLLFGRRRSAADAPVIAVLGKRGEQEVPADPSGAPVWSEIVAHHDEVGFEGDYISVEGLALSELRRHPWVLAGGGARGVLLTLDTKASEVLDAFADSIGILSFTLLDDVYVLPDDVPRRLGFADVARPFVTGDHVRDWAIATRQSAIFPYGQDFSPLLDEQGAAGHFLWRYRTPLSNSKMFNGKSKVASGLAWHEYGRLSTSKIDGRPFCVFAFVATHNNFVLSEGLTVLNRHAPFLKFKKSTTESDHRSLVGYLNSSTVAFWCRLVMFPKGGDQVGDGARLSASQWNRHLEFAANLLQQLPVPKIDDLRTKLLDLVIAAEAVVKQMADLSAEKCVAAVLESTPNLAALRESRQRSIADRARLRGILISLQEEMDWRVYGLFGLPTVEARSVEEVSVRVEPNHRPFEVRLGREAGRDISASEWFRVHKRDAPNDVSGPLADLYRQRLRLLDDADHGKQLRLLETPESKRRWSPPDDHKAFSDAVRAWLLERIEASFREHAQPELRTARQIALELGRDPAIAAAHELLTEESGLDLVRLISELVDLEGVPFLAGHRYAETGMEKRTSWEETWRLQRIEDEAPEVLQAELRRLNVKSIPVPDRYGPKDFLRHYWSLRGKLDVRKERFVTVPGGNSDEDTSPLVGWAGWNHLQIAQALSGLYQRRKSEDGWQKDRLVPLLAGLDEHVPWLLQWHNEPAADFGGMKLGDFFRDFVAAEMHNLGVAVGDLRKWMPPAGPTRTTLDPVEVLAALVAWKPEAEEDDDDDAEETEAAEGPTDAELAAAMGVTKALVSKALKKLTADGLVERLSGRPARYMAIGDLA